MRRAKEGEVDHERAMDEVEASHEQGEVCHLAVLSAIVCSFRHHEARSHQRSSFLVW